jgi:hypothetical protein
MAAKVGIYCVLCCLAGRYKQRHLFILNDNTDKADGSAMSKVQLFFLFLLFKIKKKKPK